MSDILALDQPATALVADVQDANMVSRGRQRERTPHTGQRLYSGGTEGNLNFFFIFIFIDRHFNVYNRCYNG